MGFNSQVHYEYKKLLSYFEWTKTTTRYTFLISSLWLKFLLWGEHKEKQLYKILKLNRSIKSLHFLSPDWFLSCSAELWVWPLEELKGWLLKRLSHCRLWQKFSRKRRANDALFTGGSWMEWVSPSKEAIGEKKDVKSNIREMRNTTLILKKIITLGKVL